MKRLSTGVGVKKRLTINLLANTLSTVPKVFCSFNSTTPLPTGAQNFSVYVAGISSGSKQVDAAKALIAFLTSPTANQAALTANGFETP